MTELLVVIGVIGLLSALLLPALTSAKSRSARIGCTNNLRQLGVGVRLYSDSSEDRLPNPLFNPDINPAAGPYLSYTLFYGTAGMPADLKSPLNLGCLFTSRLISAPAAFYDPGLRHSELLPVRFEMKYYSSTRHPWPKADDVRDHVRGNYMYFPLSGRPLSQPHASIPGRETWTLVATNSSQLVPDRSVLTDLIYTFRTRPHINDRNPTGLNALWGDLHVSFSATKKAFDPALWDSGDDQLTLQNPGDNPEKFRAIVSKLRP